jgi:hypothetical protein
MGKFKVYAPRQLTNDERIKHINDGAELWLAIEGRFTNLIIWRSRIHAPINPDNSEGIYMRLDKANNYSVPLSVDKLNYIENDKSCVHELGKFDFPTSVDNLEEIINITQKLIVRMDVVAW